MATASTAGGAPASLLRRLSDGANTCCEVALFALMVLMVVVTMAQVIFRFFFTALTWSEELSCFLLVLASLVGAAVAFKRGSHIAVTFLVDHLPSGGKKVMATIVDLLGLGFFGIVAVYGVVLMKAEAGQLTPAMQISMKWIYLMYPVVGGVTMLHILDSLCAIWRKEAST